MFLSCISCRFSPKKIFPPRVSRTHIRYQRKIGTESDSLVSFYELKLQVHHGVARQNISCGQQFIQEKGVIVDFPLKIEHFDVEVTSKWLFGHDVEPFDAILEIGTPAE